MGSLDRGPGRGSRWTERHWLLHRGIPGHQALLAPGKSAWRGPPAKCGREGVAASTGPVPFPQTACLRLGLRSSISNRAGGSSRPNMAAIESSVSVVSPVEPEALAASRACAFSGRSCFNLAAHLGTGAQSGDRTAPLPTKPSAGTFPQAMMQRVSVRGYGLDLVLKVGEDGSAPGQIRHGFPVRGSQSRVLFRISRDSNHPRHAGPTLCACTNLPLQHSPVRPGKTVLRPDLDAPRAAL